ncbi:hypothetical protein RRG08_024420 [Elysia crispata]|uniref:Uncharacterized protein n=1 Tax=Elysia crispata TaxID=231223 RepID=A0AAE0YPI5_9GAST|nr:hypothetical protein RRG08_024420 [Elysia crispata]
MNSNFHLNSADFGFSFGLSSPHCRGPTFLVVVLEAVLFTWPTPEGCYGPQKVSNTVYQGVTVLRVCLIRNVRVFAEMWYTSGAVLACGFGINCNYLLFHKEAASLQDKNYKRMIRHSIFNTVTLDLHTRAHSHTYHGLSQFSRPSQSSRTPTQTIHLPRCSLQHPRKDLPRAETTQTFTSVFVTRHVWNVKHNAQRSRRGLTLTDDSMTRSKHLPVTCRYVEMPREYPKCCIIS